MLPGTSKPVPGAVLVASLSEFEKEAGSFCIATAVHEREKKFANQRHRWVRTEGVR
jgi:hypothetical protein